MSGFTDMVAACHNCASLDSANRLKIADKPYAVFRVEEEWRPEGRINVLFVAESPPWNGRQSYFYNQADDKKSTNLRKEILKYLDLSLEAFKYEGYFLIDSIKCRLNKQTNASVPSEVLKKCSAKFLCREIGNLKPKTIFVLGDSARKALLGLQENPKFSEFKDLANHKITENYEKILSGYRVILCVYPGGQTRKYESNIDRSFCKIKTRLFPSPLFRRRVCWESGTKL